MQAPQSPASSDADRHATAVCTDISLDWVWSSNTVEGVIDPVSKKIFIVSFDTSRWQGWLGWPTAADSIRIGKNWDTGTPALSYELGDFNADGVQDVLFAFSTRQLIADSNFSPHTTKIRLWARDGSSTRQFCGVHPVSSYTD